MEACIELNYRFMLTNLFQVGGSVETGRKTNYTCWARGFQSSIDVC